MKMENKMHKNPCWLEETGKLHLCEHSLHHRKSTKRCEFICSDKAHKKVWCTKLVKNAKAKVNKADVQSTDVKPSISFSFLKGKAKSASSFNKKR